MHDFEDNKYVWNTHLFKFHLKSKGLTEFFYTDLAVD